MKKKKPAVGKACVGRKRRFGLSQFADLVGKSNTDYFNLKQNVSFFSFFPF